MCPEIKHVLRPFPHLSSAVVPSAHWFGREAAGINYFRPQKIVHIGDCAQATCTPAAASADYAAIVYLYHDNRIRWIPVEMTAVIASYNGHLDMSKKLFEFPSCKMGVLAGAYAGGQQHIIDWVRITNQTVNTGLCVPPTGITPPKPGYIKI